MFVKRPSAKDSDEDLLRQQEEFLKSTTVPSVRKIKKAEHTQTTLQHLPTKEIDEQVPKIVHPSVLEISRNQPHFLKEDGNEQNNLKLGKVPCKGKAPPKKKSIFAQEMEKKKKILMKASKIEPTSSSQEAAESIIIDGSGLGDLAEVERIQKENELFIQSHTCEEIHQTIAELAHLKPYIDVIRAKRQTSRSKGQILTPSPQNLSQKTVTKDNKEPVQVHPEDLPINVEEAKKWPHMDVLEEEKLAWMAPLPKPIKIHAEKRNAIVARFDFKGAILPADLDVPTQTGLHHHGEEPERAGYSIDELFTLSRSQVPGQRQISLETFASILKKYWQGCYDECFDESLLTTLLERGLVVLLRHALDESSTALISAAVKALYRLIVSEVDELCLDHIFFWDGGSINPFLFPDAFSEEEEEDIAKLSDGAILKKDVILGLLRMDILPRLRYILEVCQPKAEVVVQIIAIVTRIARHSLSAATQVYECPRLVPSLVASFLPSQWSTAKTIGEQMASAYEMPLAPVLKLFRVLSMAGPNLAFRIMQLHKIIEALKSYLVLYERDDKLPNKISMMLHIEAYRMWSVLANHSMGTSLFKDLLPIIYSHLQSIITLSLKPNPSYSVECAIALMTVLKSLVRSNEFSSLPKDFLHRLKRFTQDFVQHWVHELMGNTWVTSSSLVMVGCALALFASIHSNFVGDPNEELITEMENLEKFISSCLGPFLNSRSFTELMEECPMHSLFLSKEKPRKDPSSLPSLSSVLWASDVVPVLGMEGAHVRSTFPFMSLLTESLASFHQTCPSSLNKVVQNLIAHPTVQNYVKKILSTSASSSYFNFIELNFLKNLCFLASSLPYSVPSLQPLYYSLVLQLPRLAKETRDPNFFRHLLVQNIFHPSLIYPTHSDIKELFIPSSLLPQDVGRILIENCHVPVLKQIYLSNLPISRVPCTFVWPPKPTNTNLWPFIPLLHMHKKSLQKDFYKDYSRDIKDLEHCLHWICFLKMFHNYFFEEIPLTCQYYLLTLSFLIDDQLNLQNLRFYLETCLKLLVKEGIVFDHKRIKKEMACCPMLEEFWKHYRNLLHNYVDVSFCDMLFANYICLPLQASSSSEFKKVALQEVELLFRFLALPLDQVIVPLEKFLWPPEMNPEVLSLYHKILATGLVEANRSPLIFVIASHHLAHHLATCAEDDTLREKILSLKIKVKKYDLQ